MSRRRLGLGLALGAALVLAARLAASVDGALARPRPSHLILDRAERLLGEVPGSGEGLGFWPLPAELPEKLVVATLMTEDRHFREHAGVHLPSVARAAWQNLRGGRVISGASTIPMQVARLQHPSARTGWAKLREAVEALLLVHRHGREAVLRQYLTLAPYGNRCHGAVRAARLYFDKPLADLSWLQAAYLAALPQQPGRLGPWNPAGHAAALKRARRILTALADRGVIDQHELELALTTDLAVVPEPRRHPEALHALLRLARSAPQQPGFIHRATLDLEVQQRTVRALEKNLARWRSSGATTTAGVVVDLPSGEVLAYVGSGGYFDQQARGAIDFLERKRSPGSALKPFIYGLALERGTHTAASELPDTPLEFDVPGGGAWVPENITHTFLGPMLLRQALGNSRNIPALRVLGEVGVDQVLARLEQGGVRGVRYEPDAYGLSLAVGSLPVTPLELASLYGALANRGQAVPLSYWKGERPAAGGRVLSRDAAMLVTHVLADPEARRPGFPAGGPLDFEYAVAIKTGTSQGYRDAWAAGFSDRLLVVVWVGNHDWRRMNRVSGATAAAPALHEVLDALMPQRAPASPVATSFAAPPHAVGVQVCALSGRLPGPGCTHVKRELFVPGTEPHQACPFHAEVPLDRRTGLLAGPGCPAEAVQRVPLLQLPVAYAGWAARAGVSIAPTRFSPLCPGAQARDERPAVAIREPRRHARYLYDPDTPRALSTVRFAAQVSPRDDEVIWLVDDAPVARVGWPHELRWPMTRGPHVVRARLARAGTSSAPVSFEVDD